MPTREEIREGIEKEVVMYMISQGAMLKLPKALSLNIVKRLHSQGVVLKVDRESWSCGHIGLSVAHGNTNPRCPLIEAGYVAVEPLVEK